ncbi:hypothetical protein [Shewanella pealeana]|uniref:Lipoprotein n=1 Tax=Shewanella pealeana (strain ATCC 700345 / ANG-SQ1) TaxID=398579 RepID=A8H7E2_SHEPA|nr:hypothetical protein [Shewanella pealeana]ABV88479.1 conserved hypothetical protein [Shewanella pealeana ATCC 700345]
MKKKLAFIALVSLSVIGCSSSSDYEEKQVSAPYIGEGNKEYESLYHYGYYRGCKNAYVTAKKQTELYDSIKKDTALDGLQRFDDGWAAGQKACEDGVPRSMYNLQATK